MHSGIDPTSSLRQKDSPIIGSNCKSVSVADELRLEQGEMLQKNRCEVTILPEVKQILHMQRIDPIFGIILDDLIGNQKRFVGIRGAEAVEGKTPRKTGDGTEKTFE